MTKEIFELQELTKTLALSNPVGEEAVILKLLESVEVTTETILKLQESLIKANTEIELLKEQLSVRFQQALKDLKK